MKQYYFLLLVLFSGICHSQIINFPDAALKTKLLSATTSIPIAQNSNQVNTVIDADGDGEISQDEAAAVYYLYIGFSGISNMEGLQFFHNLKALQCKGNVLASLDLSPFPNLESINADNNQISTLNVTGLAHLKTLECHNNLLTAVNLTDLSALETLAIAENQITAFDFSTTPLLKTLTCSENSLTEIDLSMLPQLDAINVDNNNLTTLDLSHNPAGSVNCSNDNLHMLNLKNGSSTNFVIDFSGNPNLEYICGDEFDTSIVQSKINVYGYTNCHFNTYCSFTPGGTFYTINGKSRYDNENDGCDDQDFPFPYMRLYTQTGIDSGFMIFNSTGNYSYDVQAGQHIISPALEDPAYFTVSPTQAVVNFPADTSPFTQNFCVTANGEHPDLEIVAYPMMLSIPGNYTDFMIICKNKGTVAESGTVSLTYNGSVMQFIGATPFLPSVDANTLTWNTSVIEPFDRRFLFVTMHMNSPTDTPPLYAGTVLDFTASVNGTSADETPADNTLNFADYTVNSLDPNDKTCLEGNVVGPETAGKYVHYLIRFENTGTANAQNIVVKDMIDPAMFDVDSLVPIGGSHPFTTRISEGNKVEFFFQDINLPFASGSNDGYVAFKIRTSPDLVVGDSFSNSAAIYFDYNSPIVTNTATTTIQLLGTPDFEFSDAFVLYPNPAKNILNITSKNGIEVKSASIYNTLGQLLMTVTGENPIDVSQLQSGNYFLKVYSDKGMATAKFIKE